VACRWTGRAGARSVRSIPPPVVPRGGCRQGADLTGLLNQLPLEVAPPAERAQLDNEHVFDALVAALTARAVVVGATDPPSSDQEDLAAEEG